MKYFMSLVLFAVTFIGCSGESEDDLMKSAKQSIEKQNFGEAVGFLERIISEFPESELAPTALSEMATIYQNKLIENISAAESQRKAVALFKDVYNKYPDSNEAAKSLFFAGFIMANELKDYKEATEMYSLFIEKYPRHELTASAKAELDNMGIPPEQILEKKVLTEK